MNCAFSQPSPDASSQAQVFGEDFGFAHGSLRAHRVVVAVPRAACRKLLGRRVADAPMQAQLLALIRAGLAHLAQPAGRQQPAKERAEPGGALWVVIGWRDNPIASVPDERNAAIL